MSSSFSSATPAWEQSKENTAPLARGRKIETLNNKARNNNDDDVSSQKAYWESLVSPGDSEEDPLTPWLGYIRYCQELSDGTSAFLVMERCVRALLSDRRYANDVRFVRVCVLYADRTDCPHGVLQHLHRCHVGHAVALFWIAWAWVAETRHDFAGADRVFQKGLQKQAQPLTLLQQRYKQFQRRHAKYMRAQLQLLQQQQHDDDDDDAYMEQEQQGERRALGGLQPARLRRNDGQSRVPTTVTHPSTGATTTVSNHAFAIYSDENHDSHDILHNDDQTVLQQPHSLELESQASRRKENTLQPERWNQRPQHAATAAATTTTTAARTFHRPTTTTTTTKTTPFSIHVDDDCAKQHQEKLQHLHSKYQQALQDRRTVEDPVQSLRQQPLQYIQKQQQIQQQQSKETTNQKTITCGFDKSLLVSKHGHECCFQEQRALQQYYTLLPATTNVNLLFITKDDSEAEMETQSTGSRKVLFSVSMESPLIHADNSREEETINTKFALKELSMMFSSPVVGNTSTCVDHDDDKTGGCAETHPAFAIHHDDDGLDEPPRKKAPFVPNDDETATLSLFGQAVEALNDFGCRDRPACDLDASMMDDDFRKYKPRDSGAILTDAEAAFGDISLIGDRDSSHIDFSPTKENLVTYKTLHKDNVKWSLRQLERSAQTLKDAPFSTETVDLAVLLSNKKSVVNLATQPLPKGLKRKASTQGQQISVGSKTGVVRHELGRGSYGVVVLLDSIAVKAQSPTDCLAWEYLLLTRLEERMQHQQEVPFPGPLAFVTLADGAMLSMTAGSSTGMNLVDLSNVYRIKEGGTVPELVALHYTARMLKHMEALHWHGKILHCDVKPDNWVMVASDKALGSCVELIDTSDLMLVDFGRALDLVSAAKDDADPMDVKFLGMATAEDMACVAMRKNLGWSFDVDTFGICASAHVLLYGSHIEIEVDRSSKRWNLVKPLRRYWQKELWTQVFDTLLNLDEFSQIAMGSRPRSLKELRGKIETYLATRSKELESLLKHQARILPKERLG